MITKPVASQSIVFMISASVYFEERPRGLPDLIWESTVFYKPFRGNFRARFQYSNQGYCAGFTGPESQDKISMTRELEFKVSPFEA